MKSSPDASHHHLAARLIAALLFLAVSAGPLHAAESKLMLSGNQEVPLVQTAASGSGSIDVKDSKSVSGSVTTTGISATMAHIHIGGAGKNGPVIIPLAKSGDNSWAVPAGASLNDEQYAAYKAGGLYVNVHSSAHPGGEIRAQIKP